MAIFESKNIVMAQGVYCYIEGLNFVNFGPIHGFYNHYLVLEDNTRGLGAEIRFLMGSKTFFFCKYWRDFVMMDLRFGLWQWSLSASCFWGLLEEI